jgi:hypothetical protein
VRGGRAYLAAALSVSSMNVCTRPANNNNKVINKIAGASAHENCAVQAIGQEELLFVWISVK